ncbi:YbaB/EbfC family nucleoid-associated protein [Dactylosporangium roseum]|uniref:YbaB/EbfC family nucleoid-associated protein n=1 Tax=Dactylosporangium roseum TaxID=47989 RepID=A0ABY5ZDS0_9ACTN|nr:YbaB/EbfC family nucleoid-associated protein [Dactylosporangium roseum]UWZ38907.1 YbaB/EbfC family nucleoid-associated protein [Dactylosporangium roseum]
MDNRALRARADELLGELDRIRLGMNDLGQQLRQITAIAKSDDGFITAVVGPRGQLIRLDIDPRVYRRPDSRQLAISITKTIQAATQDAMDKVAEACKPYLPDDQVQAHLQFDTEGMSRRLDAELDLKDLER